MNNPKHNHCNPPNKIGENPRKNMNNASRRGLSVPLLFLGPPGGARRSTTTTSADKKSPLSNDAVQKEEEAMVGNDVNTLRGLSGADFEGYCKVDRGEISLLCSCLFRKIEELGKKNYVFIKGPNLFVYETKTSTCPNYAINLAHKKCTVHPPAVGAGGHTQLVTLESGLGDVEYQFQFDTRGNPEIVKKFAAAVRGEIAMGDTMEIKKKLGHETDADMRKSVRYASVVAENHRSHDDDKQDSYLHHPIGMTDIAIKETFISGGVEVYGF